MTRDDAMKALHDANPRRDDGGGHDGLRDRIVATDPGAAVSRASRRRTYAWRLSAAGVAVAVVAGYLAFNATAPTGSPSAPPSAYAAVRQAIAVTASAAGSSGTIVTSLRAAWPERTVEVVPPPVPGHPSVPRSGGSVVKRLEPATLHLDTTFKWHGDDLSLMVGTAEQPQSGTESRYVAGRYYETRDGGWIHQWQNDEGKNPRVGATWVDGAREDISGSRIRRVVSALQDLRQERAADGTVTYSGTATAKAIAGEFRDDEGLPYASRPFPKLGDPEAIATVRIVVGVDGIIRSWTCSYEWDDAEWVYTAEYRDLGTTSAIAAPDPSTVTESDGTQG